MTGPAASFFWRWEVGVEGRSRGAGERARVLRGELGELDALLRARARALPVLALLFALLALPVPLLARMKGVRDGERVAAEVGGGAKVKEGPR
jgi:hypothetical protein